MDKIIQSYYFSIRLLMCFTSSFQAGITGSHSSGAILSENEAEVMAGLSKIKVNKKELAF